MDDFSDDASQFHSPSERALAATRRILASGCISPDDLATLHEVFFAEEPLHPEAEQAIDLVFDRFRKGMLRIER